MRYVCIALRVMRRAKITRNSRGRIPVTISRASWCAFVDRSGAAGVQTRLHLEREGLQSFGPVSTRIVEKRSASPVLHAMHYTCTPRVR